MNCSFQNPPYFKQINLSYSPIVQSAVHNRNATLHVATSPPRLTSVAPANTRSANQSNGPNHFVLRNSRRLFVDEKLLWSSPGRVANVTRSNQTRKRFITVQALYFSEYSPSPWILLFNQFPAYITVHELAATHVT